MKRWFISFVHVHNGHSTYGCLVKESKETPVQIVKRWHDEHCKDHKTGGSVLLHFQEVGPEFREQNWSAT